MIRRNGACGGFTLVELMVSITGGLFVAIAVFMLAKQATNLYQSEGRVGNATLGSLVGFERLRQDIERASFLSTPNVRFDPKVCGDPINDDTWPAYLRHLQGVMITQSASTIDVLSKNGSNPDEITLAGNYTSDDKFFAQKIAPGGGNDVVTLQSDQGGLPKLGYLASTDKTNLLLGVFHVGSALRIVDKSNGKESYGTIVGVEGGPPANILLKTGNGGPSLIYRSGSALKCGIDGASSGSAVNAVNIIHYAIRDMSTNAAYKPLFDNPAGLGPAQESLRRAELIREELDTNGDPLAGTLELVTEFAVDLKFGVTVARIVPVAGNTVNQPWKIETLSPGNPEVVVRAGDTSGVVKPTLVDPPIAPAPQLVRTVRVRLGVRSREADRQTGLDGGGALPMAPGLYRIGTSPTGGGPYARVRTMQADVALHSQQRATFL